MLKHRVKYVICLLTLLKTWQYLQIHLKHIAFLVGPDILRVINNNNIDNDDDDEKKKEY